MHNYMTTNAVGCFPTGGIFKIDDRRVTLAAVYAGEGDGALVDLRDMRTGTPVMARNPETNETFHPTVGFLRDAYRSGRLRPEGEPENASDRQGRFALLDPDACEDRDRRSPWRQRLAERANGAGIANTDRANHEFLEAEFGREKGDLAFPKPSASALRRWRTKLRKAGGKRYALVSQAGRPRGRSQLHPKVNALVHEAALFYWTRPGAQKIDAHSWLEDQIRQLGENLEGDPYVLPSKQTMYKRIDSLRCYDTVKAKRGQKEADRLYKGSGEAITVNDLLDVVLMDATTLEQIIVFDEDWMLPACKVRIVALMCAKSHAITGFHVYAGPNRGETSIEAVLASMTPPDVSPEGLEEMPVLAWIFGRPRSLLPDNEKALIAPSTIDSFNELGIDILMPPIEMPTAKAALERFFRFLKQALAQLPGTIIDPKRAQELGYDPVGPALTLPQIRKVVASVVEQHNISPSRGLGGISPARFWHNLQHRRATPIFEDIEHARRVLGRTAEVLLTRDGIELNGIRYRDAAIVSALLDNLGSVQKARGRRKDDSITAVVKARLNPGNIDCLQVYDPIAECWHTLPSTQPLYTDRLSEWEHEQFRRQAKLRNEPFSSEAHRLRSKKRTMNMVVEMAPKVKFQQRSDMAALWQSEKVEQLAGRKFKLPPSIEGISTVQQESVERGRVDKGVRITARKTTDKRDLPPVVESGVASEHAYDRVVWDGIASPMPRDLPDEYGSEGEARV